MKKKKLTDKELTSELEMNTDYYASHDMLNLDVRKAVDLEMTRELPPAAVAGKTQLAKAGNAKAAYEVISDVKEKDLNYGSAREAVIEAAMSLNLAVEPGDTATRSKVIADAVNTLIHSPNARNNFKYHLEYPDYGACYSFIQWNADDPALWVPNLIPQMHRNFTYDLKTGRTPLILSTNPGEAPQPLDYRKFFVTMIPGAGLPYLQSDGLLGARVVAIKRIIEKSLVGLVQIYGQPMRIGKLDKTAGSGKELELKKRVLRKALENLGNDAWAILSEGLDIKFEESADASNVGLYLDPIRYFDEQVTKKITGSVLATGTGNTGSGGSQALGNVHSDALYAKAKSQFETILNAYIEQVVRPFIDINFGEGSVMPKITAYYSKDIPIETLINAVEKLVGMGAEISEEEIKAKLGLRTPEAGEKLLTKAAIPAPVAQTNPENPSGGGFKSQSFAAETETDQIDTLLTDFEELQSEDIPEEVLQILSQFSDFEQVKAKLIEWAETGEVTAQEDTAAIIAAAGAAGQLGAVVGD